MEKVLKQVFLDKLLEFAKKNEKIVVLSSLIYNENDEEILRFKENLGDRFFDLGNIEQGIGICSGLVASGYIPFYVGNTLSFMKDYINFRNIACIYDLPIKIIALDSGVSNGYLGAGGQIIEDLSFLRSFPNIEIFQPSDRIEANNGFEKVLNSKKITYVRLSNFYSYDVNQKGYEFNFGKNTKILNHGLDGVVFASGTIIGNCAVAIERLYEDGIKLTLINVSSISPLDTDNIKELCSNSKNIFTVEDHSVIGGIGTIIAEIIAENGIKTKLNKIGVNGFGRQGNSEIYNDFGFDIDSLYNQINSKIKKDF